MASESEDGVGDDIAHLDGGPHARVVVPSVGLGRAARQQWSRGPCRSPVSLDCLPHVVHRKGAVDDLFATQNDPGNVVGVETI